MSSMQCVQNFGGDKLEMIGRFIKKAGVNYLSQRKRAGWGYVSKARLDNAT